MNHSKATRLTGFRHGFALVATLSLMILLAILAVGLLGLSSVVLRSSAQGDAQAEARANARMALMMAIGELQREMGPDSRISAPEGAASGASGGSPRWTAVYDAWKWNVDAASPETPTNRSPEFRGWLASGANQATGGPAGLSDTATLVGTGTLGDSAAPDDRVEVPMQGVSSGKTKKGRIAWWVSDESVKAKVNAGPDTQPNGAFGNSDPLFNAQSAPNVNQQQIPALSGFEWKNGERQITVSSGGLMVAADLAVGGLGTSIHDLTVHSAGVLTDVRAGRLRRDLSHLLSRPAVQMQEKPLYLADGRMNRFDVSADGLVSNRPFIPTSNAPNTSSEWGIGLEELHLFHNIHREFTWSGASPSLAMRTTREQVVRDRYFIYKRPVIDAVQFIFSLKAEPHSGSYRMVMMIDGMVALTNPNDVAISWPPGLLLPVQLQNIPYTLTWNITTKDGTQKNKQSSDSANFGLFVGRVGGGTSGNSSGFTLEPGESAVFGSTTGSGAQLDLQRGFNPSGGVRMVPDSNGSGWRLNANGLKLDDNIDFSLIKGDTGFAGHHTYYNAWVGDRRSNPKAMGWQIDASILTSNGSLSSPRLDEMLISPIRPPQVRPVSDFTAKPQPVMMLSFLRNQEQSSRAAPPDSFASRPLHLSEASSAGRSLIPASIDASLHSNQALITVEPLNFQFRTLAAGAGGRNTYHGGGRQPNLGGNFNVVKRRLPIAPPLSFGAFENAIASGLHKRFGEMSVSPGLAIGGDPFPKDAVALTGHSNASPNLSKSIANSWSNPFLSLGKVYSPPGSGLRVATDHSWMANTALWDSWFLSGIVDGTGINSASWFKDARTPRAQFSDLAKGTGTLRNKRLLFHAGKSADAALDELFETSGNFKTSALNKLPAYLMIDGAFNVNSTSEDAWAAFLSSVRDQEILTGNGTKQGFEHPFGTLGYAVNTALTGTQGDWMGLRSLSSGEIRDLAEAIVTEVKARGPFLSMADFVNRRPASGDSGQQALGALQAAIDSSGLNSRFTGAGRSSAAADFDPLPGGAGIASEPTPSRAIGSAGYLSQAAVLTSIGSQIAVRGDTFVVRAYGDSRNADGDVVARAWCEAVVQRIPDYLDPTDAPEAQDGWPQSSNKLSETNSRFGRRMKMVSFRWLHSDEI